MGYRIPLAREEETLMAKNKTDLRIIKTKKKLSQALIELLQEKNYENIKISDLCVRAGISRATFYNNFIDIDDVMNYYFETAEDRIRNLFLSQLRQSDHSFTDAYRSLIRMVISTIISDENHIFSILSKNSAAQVYMVLQTFIDDCIKMLIDYYKDQIVGISSGIIASYLAGAFTGIIYYLLHHPEEAKNRDEVEQTVFNITAPIFREIARKPFFVNSL